MAAPFTWCVDASAEPAPTERVIVELRAKAEDARMPPAAELPHVRPGPLKASVTARIQALEVRKSALLDALAAGPGAPPRVVHAYRPFGLLALDVTPGQRARLEAMSDVARVWPDRLLEPQLDSSLPYVQAPTFQQTKASGAGTTVAVLDTPVRLGDSAFGSCPSAGAQGCRVRLRLNFASSFLEEVMSREDQLGIGSHGTNVAAVVLGVAPEADVVSLNVFHSDPSTGAVGANLSDTLAAMAWVADNAEAYGVVAVNTSLGTARSDAGPCNDSASFDPIRVLHRDHGVLTVTVSGNDALGNAVRDPGCVSSAVTVGAVFDHDDTLYSDIVCSQAHPHAGQLACFSNLNGMVDIVAPGVDVSAGGFTMTGTSQAAPHAAGAIAAWQSWYLAQDGAFRSAAWMQRNLLASSASPLIHSDARSFSQLRMGEGVDWAYAHAFGWWYDEQPDNVIPTSAEGLQEQLVIGGQDWDVEGTYLYLELVHAHPEDLQLTLTSPSGAVATVQLPYGQSNFTGLVGRTVFPGAFSPVAGSPASGTWTLSLRDLQGRDTGHYLQGALYLTRKGCEPRCEAEGCGDDRCGGRCGDICIIDGSCHLDGDRQDGQPCMGCRPASSFAAWSALEGASCDDGDSCTTNDVCHGDRCEGEHLAACGGASGGPADEVPPSVPGPKAQGERSESGGCACRSVTMNSRGRAGSWVVLMAAALCGLGAARRRGA